MYQSASRHPVVASVWAEVAQSEYPLHRGCTVRESNAAGGTRFSTPGQTGTGARPASDGMGTGFPFLWQSGRGVALTTHPPPSAEVPEREDLYLYSASGRSWPVLGKLYLFTSTDTPNSSVDVSTSTATVVKENAISLSSPPPPPRPPGRGKRIPRPPPPPPPWRCGPTWVMASSFLRLLDHTQRRITVGRTPGRVISASQISLPDNTQHSQQTDIHAPGWIRTHNFCRRGLLKSPFLLPQTPVTYFHNVFCGL